MDPASVLLSETVWKLGEVESYLLELEDITDSIDAEVKAEAAAAQAAAAEARRHKLRMVRDAHAAWERERERDRELAAHSSGFVGRADRSAHGGSDAGMSASRRLHSATSSTSHSTHASQSISASAHPAHSREWSRSGSMAYK